MLLQRSSPRRLRPVKRAPTCGPVAPSIQAQEYVSGLQSPMRVMSETRLYTRSGDASIYTSASPRNGLRIAAHGSECEFVVVPTDLPGDAS